MDFQHTGTSPVFESDMKKSQGIEAWFCFDALAFHW